MIVLLSLVAWGADCPELRSRGDLDAAMRVARESVLQSDRQSLDAALRQAREIVPCLTTPVDPGVAAELHLLEGSNRWLAWPEDPSQPWGPYLGAAKRAQADPPFLRYVLPADHPVQDLWESTSSVQVIASHIPPVAGGTLWLDGRPAEVWAVGQPALIQRVKGVSAVDGLYLNTGGEFPKYQSRSALRYAGAIGLTGSLVCLAVAQGQRSDYEALVSTCRTGGPCHNPAARAQDLRLHANVSAISGLVLLPASAAILGYSVIR